MKMAYVQEEDRVMTEFYRDMKLKLKHLEDELRWGRHKRGHIEEEEATMPTLIIEEVVQYENEEIIVCADEGDLLDDMPFSMDTYVEDSPELFPSLEPARMLEMRSNNFEEPHACLKFDNPGYIAAYDHHEGPLESSSTLLFEEMLAKDQDGSHEQETMSFDCIWKGDDLFEHDVRPLPTNAIELHFTMGKKEKDDLLLEEFFTSSFECMEDHVELMERRETFPSSLDLGESTCFDHTFEPYLRYQTKEQDRTKVKLPALDFHDLTLIESDYTFCYFDYIVRLPPPRRCTYTLHRGFLHKSGKLCVAKGDPKDRLMKERQGRKIINGEGKKDIYSFRVYS